MRSRSTTSQDRGKSHTPIGFHTYGTSHFSYASHPIRLLKFDPLPAPPLPPPLQPRLETMCAAVEKLLEKYQPAEAVEEEGVVHDDADGAVHEDADGASG